MKILCLDDDALVARSMARILRLRGHDCVLVSTIGMAEEALLGQGPFDAVIADYGLGAGECGVTTLEWTRVNHPGTIRILMSGASKPRGFTENPPMDVFLSKPFEISAIEDILAAKPKPQD